MICIICGAKCTCKKASNDLCCSCHRHKVRGFKVITYNEKMPMSREVFFASMEKHQIEAEQRLLEFQKQEV
ncbi:MAG: hypothetical protein J2P31_13280 [Blastocatellia bacterium]|nr:hypothetical protein [Blastocatellia bacterium]